MMATLARQAAFGILLRVRTQASYADELLRGELTDALSPPDAALCTELVLGTLRRQGTLDFLAQHFAQGRWASFDAEVQVALRLGLYQLRFLSRVPARAAVYEAVELVKEAGKRSAAGLVNAILRRGAEANLDSLRPPGLSEIAWSSITESHPLWLLERWSSRYGWAEAVALAKANNEPAITYLRLNAPEESADPINRRLREQGVQTRPGNFLKRCRAVAEGNVGRGDLYRQGTVSIQDEASQMVSYLLKVQEGHRVLDLCAAPGNKTAQLAEWVGRTGRVVASDLHFHRLRELRARASAEQILPVVLDGRQPLPFRSAFDRILVDAPCTGTGTLRRHPEIKWRLAPADVAALAEKQSQLLSNAAPLLSVGGRMVYSTCSLEKEENEEVVANFLKNHSEFRLIPLRAEVPRLQPYFHRETDWILEEDFLQTTPARHATDGFFAAILEKVFQTIE